MKRNINVAAACILMLMAGNADAAKLTMPGSSCKAYTGSNASNVSVIGVTGLINVGSYYVGVSCPIERLGSVHTLAINIYHPNNRSTSCTVGRANSLTGSTEYKNVTLTGQGNLATMFPAFSNVGANEDDVYGLYCWLEPASILRGYDWIN